VPPPILVHLAFKAIRHPRRRAFLRDVAGWQGIPLSLPLGFPIATIASRGVGLFWAGWRHRREGDAFGDIVRAKELLGATNFPRATMLAYHAKTLRPVC
jgi:hypothetical protein